MHTYTDFLNTLCCWCSIYTKEHESHNLRHVKCYVSLFLIAVRFRWLYNDTVWIKWHSYEANIRYKCFISDSSKWCHSFSSYKSHNKRKQQPHYESSSVSPVLLRYIQEGTRVSASYWKVNCILSRFSPASNSGYVFNFLNL